MYFSSHDFKKISSIYLASLKPILATSWIAVFSHAISDPMAGEDLDDSIQILNMVRNWHKWDLKRSSVLHFLLWIANFMILLVLGSICAAIALLKTCLWAVAIVPSLGAAVLGALRFGRRPVA